MPYWETETLDPADLAEISHLFEPVRASMEWSGWKQLAPPSGSVTWRRPHSPRRIGVELDRNRFLRRKALLKVIAEDCGKMTVAGEFWRWWRAGCLRRAAIAERLLQPLVRLMEIQRLSAPPANETETHRLFREELLRAFIGVNVTG